jgi:hypothetical protein
MVLDRRDQGYTYIKRGRSRSEVEDWT